jgi:hypothetical protein
MTTKYPSPPVRPRVAPGKGVPLRQWASASYDPSNGRAASSIDETPRKSYTWGDRATCRPNAQGPDGGFHAADARRTQGKTPVKNRPYG